MERTALSQSNYMLWKDNITDYKVIIPSQDNLTAIHAAQELCRIIARGLIYLPDDGSGYEGQPVISIGDTSVSRALNVSSDGIIADGYKVTTSGKTIVIVALRNSGLLNGVYGLMRAVWGYKAYSHDELGISNAVDMELKDLDLLDNPDFVGRDVHYKDVMENIHPLYASRMRLNGVRNRYGEGEGEGCAWSVKLWAHTHFKLLPKDKYYTENPQWYSEDGTTICLTDDNARQELTHNLLPIIETDKNSIFFAVTQEDGATKCTCERCLAAYDEYGGVSGVMMRFTNAVARDVKTQLQKIDPQRVVYLVTFAYQYTLKPPVKVIDEAIVPVHESVIAEDNVVVRIAPLYNCFSHDIMTSPCNVQFKQSLVGWSAVSQRLAVWSYCTGFGCYMIPFNNLETMQEVYKLYKKFGVIDILDQGPSDTIATPLASLRIFLQSELIWDTEIDYEEAIEDFCNHYYKDASAYVYRYIQLIRQRYSEIEDELVEIGEAFHARPSTRFSTNWEKGEMWSKDFVWRTVEIFAQAIKVAGEITDEQTRDKVLARLRTDSLSPRYMLINFYGYGMPKDKISQIIDEFERDAALCGLTHYREGYKVSFKMDEARRYILDGSCFL